LLYRETYKNGEIDGRSEVYGENGRLRTVMTFKDGVMDGLVESYYENGQLESRSTWNMGEMCGEWIEDGEARTHPLALLDGNPTPRCPPDLEDGN